MQRRKRREGEREKRRQSANKYVLVRVPERKFSYVTNQSLQLCERLEGEA